jgi:hypothetical protein
MDAATAQAQLGNAAKSFLAGKNQLLIVEEIRQK